MNKTIQGQKKKKKDTNKYNNININTAHSLNTNHTALKTLLVDENPLKSFRNQNCQYCQTDLNVDFSDFKNIAITFAQ